MKTFIEYDDVKPCPCGSQKTYNTCCKLKSIRWGFDESGAWVKQLPMSLETEEELKATRSMVKNKETIQENCSLALDMLYENSEGVCAYNFLSQAQRAVEACAQSGAGLDDVSEKMAEFLWLRGYCRDNPRKIGTGRNWRIFVR